MSNILAWAAGPAATELLVSNRDGLWHWTAQRWLVVEPPPGEPSVLELVSVAHDALEVTVRGQRSWRAPRTDYGWGAWEPTTDDKAAPAADPRLRLSAANGLLIRLPNDATWTDLGGYLAGGLADVAIIDRPEGGIDVYALWADGSVQLLTHAPDVLPQWGFIAAAPAAATTRTVLRAADMVTLTVRGVGLREAAGPNGNRQWVADGAAGRLVVELPPQHIAETLLTAGSSESRLAGPSTLHFDVPVNTPIVLSTNGILSAMTTLCMRNDPWVQGQATTLELPWRLLLAVQKTAKCRHGSGIVQAVDGATIPMWHTRVLGGSLSGYAEVRPMAAPDAEVPFANNTPLHNKMVRIAQAGRDNPDKTVKVDGLILSPCGAWFSGSVTYPNLDWTHQTAMGRDYYVRIAIRGTLFPFGHGASVISVSQREFDVGTKTAGLQEKWALVITEPTKPYDVAADNSREFPFSRVDIEPVRVIPLQGPPLAPNNKAYWLRHPDNRPVDFTVRAWSPDGPVTMQLPMLFSDTGVDAQKLKNLYAAGPGAVSVAGGATTRLAAATPPKALVDRAIPLVVKKVGNTVQKVDNTTVAVRSMILSATVNGADYFPRIDELEVVVPSITELTGGAAPPIVAKFAREVVTNPAGRFPTSLLQFTKSVALDFAATKAGSMAAANMTVNELSTKFGPTVAKIPNIPNMTPAQLFNESATVLGIVPLAKVMEKVTEPPKITWAHDPPRALMDWNETLKGEVGPFKTNDRPDGTSVSKVIVHVDTADPRRGVLTTVSITDFSVGIPSPDNYYIKLIVSKLDFEASSGALPKTSFTVGGLDLGRELVIVKKLGDVMKNALGSGPSLEVNTREIKVSYALAAPTPLGLGLISIQNLMVQAGLTLSLAGDPIIVDFALGTRGHPFLVTVMGFGGGGYLELGVSARDGGGLERFVGGIEFGAMVAMNFGVAQGEVHIFGGVVFVKQGSELQITGYIRVGGSVRVLGLITVSIELTVSLTYKTPNILKGEARLVIAVDLTFWSTSVEIPASYTITGSRGLAIENASDTLSHPVAAALGPVGNDFPWRDYCQAYA